MRFVWWGLGLVVGYLVLAPLLMVGALWAMLTAGVIDWSGEGRAAPEDPLVIGYRGDPGAAFGWPFETVRYRTELGEAEAWVVPAGSPSDTWAIWVHGIGGTRENGYRIVKTLHEAGLPVLMISYRNDRMAPRSADGLYSFGLSEWPDLETAVDYAVGRGAQRVVIAAESMGAAVTGQYLKRGNNTERVAGLVLDAPALDLPEIIRAGGQRYWVPVADYVNWAGQEVWKLGARDLSEAVTLDAVAEFAGPIFLVHGTGDPLVPYSISERLVAKRPDITFWSTESSRHPMSFEEDRAGYAAALRAWVDDLMAGTPN